MENKIQQGYNNSGYNDCNYISVLVKSHLL